MIPQEQMALAECLAFKDGHVIEDLDVYKRDYYITRALELINMMRDRGWVFAKGSG